MSSAAESMTLSLLLKTQKDFQPSPPAPPPIYDKPPVRKRAALPDFYQVNLHTTTIPLVQNAASYKCLLPHLRLLNPSVGPWVTHDI